MQLTQIFAAGILFASGLNANADQEQVERGRYLVHAGGCITCHTADADDAVALAGGYAIESPFGTFYSPNITPDLATGIGGWTDEEFVNAFWEGVSPDGQHYFPAFPYTAYTGVSRDDLLAMKAYLFSLAPESQVSREHDLAWYMSSRLAAGAWKLKYFTPRRFAAEESQSERWNRGAYLVRHLGHCGECHTPRSATGALQSDRELAGSGGDSDGDKVPNITPDKNAGIGSWSAGDIDYFLEVGMLPDGDFTGSSMSDVIEDNTGKLTGEDRTAIAEYLQSLQALGDDLE